MNARLFLLRLQECPQAAIDLLPDDLLSVIWIQFSKPSGSPAKTLLFSPFISRSYHFPWLALSLALPHSVCCCCWSASSQTAIDLSITVTLIRHPSST